MSGRRLAHRDDAQHPVGMGSPALLHSPEGAGSAGSRVGGLSPLSFAGSEERASLRDDVRRGVDEATTPRASPALVARAANRHPDYSSPIRQIGCFLRWTSDTWHDLQIEPLVPSYLA